MDGRRARMSRSLAFEYASRGIRVNAVSPGIIQTPMYPAESHDALGSRLPPLGTVGQVSDIVDGMLFLEASPFITHRRPAGASLACGRCTSLATSMTASCRAG
jgi:NAD(P)-dependent dehydrogenase (short-subunit alcohol dehydrogenase family)